MTTGTANASRDYSRMLTRLLVAILITFSVLPIVIFATDMTNSRVARSARSAVAQRTGRTDEDLEARRARVRVSRARIHPTVGNAIGVMLIQLFWVAMGAAVGRRIFGLRL